MALDSIIFLNLAFYIFGFLILLGLRYTIFNGIADWISILINVLGVIFALNMQNIINGEWYTALDWISVGSFKLNLDVAIDNQSLFMYLLVQLIALFIQIFSSKYIKNDPGVNRFYAFMNLFMFAMVGLIVAGNMLLLYFFWELVGLSSFLLIGFWFTKKTNNEAAFKAFIINRVGDAFLFIGIIILYNLYGTLNFSVLQSNPEVSMIPGLDFLSISQLKTVVIIFIFIGVMAKSAQFPLQIWLPSAMVGPTPASALIHAATMVVAGVYLLARLHTIITPEAGFFIAIIGCITSIMGGFSAIFQYDIKRVLAYSTISQLGLMVAGIGIGAIGATLFHLNTHAFFKAGLFLCVAVVINYFNHEQDMRKMGNLTRKIPIVFWCYFVFAASIIGVPLTAGYLSKEALLTSAVNYGMVEGQITYKICVAVMLAISSFLTAFYIIRQFVMVFFERQDSPVDKILNSTKRTMAGAIKSFKGLLSAENERNIDNNDVIGFFQKITTFEISILGLAIGSLWVFFAFSPISFEGIWFLNTFGFSQTEHFWIPVVAFSIFVLALLISFNTTLEEIRKYYFEERQTGYKQRIFRMGYYNFFMEKAISSFFVKLFIGKPIAKMDSLKLNTGEVKYVYLGGLSKKISQFDLIWVEGFISKLVKGFLKTGILFKEIEKKVVDRTISLMSTKILKLGDKIRFVQGGQLQIYIIAMFVCMLFLIFIKIL